MTVIVESISADLGANPRSKAYADGPFVLMVGDSEGFGELLYPDGEDLLVNAETRTFRIPNPFTYTISEDGRVITFTRENFENVWTIRPIELEDADWAYPDFKFNTVKQLKDFASYQMKLLKGAVPGMATSYGATLDEDDTVLELVRSDDAGVFVRDNSQWVAIDIDDPSASDTIDGREWVDLNPSFVPIFDANSAQDTLSRADIAPFIIE